MVLRISMLISIISILSACTLPGTQSEGIKKEGTIIYSGSGFTMAIPSDWDTTGQKSIQSPKNGEIMLKAISPEIHYGFSNNIIVMKDILEVPMTSKKYSEMNQIQTMKNYLEYAKISDEVILFGDDDESRVTVFEAKYNITTPRMKFIQTVKTCGTNVYLLHASIALDKTSDNYIALFRTFSCN